MSGPRSIPVAKTSDGRLVVVIDELNRLEALNRLADQEAENGN